MNETQKKLIKSYLDRLDIYSDKSVYNEGDMNGFYVLFNPVSQEPVGIIYIIGGLVQTASFDDDYFNFRYIGFHTQDKHEKSVISDYILGLLYDKGILQYRTIDYNYVSLRFKLSNTIRAIIKRIESGDLIKI